jgi:hypothetical protein
MNSQEIDSLQVANDNARDVMAQNRFEDTTTSKERCSMTVID